MTQSLGSDACSFEVLCLKTILFPCYYGRRGWNVLSTTNGEELSRRITTQGALWLDLFDFSKREQHRPCFALAKLSEFIRTSLPSPAMTNVGA